MVKFYNSAAGEPVRRYLLSLARQTGSLPEKIPAERDLAELLGVARGTVRDAIASLEEQNYLIRIPGRKGAFTNPQSANAVMISIGVLSGANWFDRLRQQTLRGFSDVLFENRIDYSFHMELTNGMIDQRFMQTIRHSGHSLLLDLNQNSEQVEMLQNVGIPIVNYCSEQLFDEVHAGRLVADFFLKRGCRKVIYWCADDARYRHFQDRMHKNQAECIVEPPDQIGKAESFLTDACLKKTDGMFLGLNLYNISDMLKFLSAKKANFPILLPPALGLEMRLKDYPLLNLHQMDLDFWDNAILQTGRQLGTHALELLRNPQAKPVYTPVPYYKILDA